MEPYTNKAYHKGISDLYYLFLKTLDLTLNLLPFVFKTNYNIDNFNYNLQSILMTRVDIPYINEISKDTIKDINDIVYCCDSVKLSKELIDKYASNAEMIYGVIRKENMKYNENAGELQNAPLYYTNKERATRQAGEKAAIGKEQIDRIF